MGLGTPDCPIFPGMYEYVTLAAGGTLTAARAILAGEARVAFNPSGGFHHAQPGNAAGFCYVNDIVLAALELREAVPRVLFLDIDVHHCDGVQDAFYARADVMTISMHETGRTLFPGTGGVEETGRGEGLGYTVNIPLPVGTYDAAYLRAFREIVVPLIGAYDPDAILLEIGMDTLAGDPLAHLHLTNNAPAEIVAEVLNFGKPLVATGGGGYNIENTVRGWALCWSVLCGDQSRHDDQMIGMGGVMLENTDWSGGLRDRVLLSDAGRRADVDREIDAAIAAVRRTVFPVHGL
jgi:acetoin utilization protein AcuC